MTRSTEGWGEETGDPWVKADVPDYVVPVIYSAWSNFHWNQWSLSLGIGSEHAEEMSCRLGCIEMSQYQLRKPLQQVISHPKTLEEVGQGLGRIYCLGNGKRDSRFPQGRQLLNLLILSQGNRRRPERGERGIKERGGNLSWGLQRIRTVIGMSSLIGRGKKESGNQEWSDQDASL